MGGSGVIGVFFCAWFMMVVAKDLHPVILVPGDGGSQMLAKINKTKTVSYVCEKTSDWFYLWLDPTQLLPYLINCWTDNIKLVYDRKTHTTINSEGVQVSFPDFGNTTSVEYLDVGRSSYAHYFGSIVESLLEGGYERKLSIFGVPYDFRKAANEHEELFSNMTRLVEEAYAGNGDRSVIFVTHSMGSIMIQYFLVHKTKAWKDKYVRSFISISGPFGGTMRAVKVFAVGDNLGNYFVSPTSLRFEQRTNPSLAWMMPSPDVWTEDDVLVQAKNVNITVKNMNEFYEMMNETDGRLMREDTLPLLEGIPAPQVEMHCWHGVNVPTVNKLVYHVFPTTAPVVKTEDRGDGTVNLRSLEACLRWRKEQKEEVYHRAFDGVSHNQMLRLDGPVQALKTLITQINRST